MAENRNQKKLYPTELETLRSNVGSAATKVTGEESNVQRKRGIDLWPTYQNEEEETGRADEFSSPNPNGRLEDDNSFDLDRRLGGRDKKRNKDERLRIGTWNVRTMNRKGKLENLKREMERNSLDVVGVSEMRWRGEGDFWSEKHRIIYAGGEENKRGVGIVLKKDLAKRVNKIIQKSDRLLLVKIQNEPRDIVIIQVYMPTTDYNDEEVEAVYEQLEEMLKEVKGKDLLVIMGDWNAVLGEGKDGMEVGRFGLGRRNDRGQMMVDFCKRKKLVVMNTWFMHEKRRRYTWKKPGDTERFQLDYMLVNTRYRNCVKDARSYPGADIDSDHNLVMMKIHIRLKKVIGKKQTLKWDTDKIKSVRKAFENEIEQEIRNNMRRTRGVEEKWKTVKEIVVKGAEKHIGYKKRKPTKKPWITDKMRKKMDERRKWKKNNTEHGKTMYRRINNDLKKETDKAREEWWQQQCMEIEDLEKRGKMDKVYSIVKQISGQRKRYNEPVTINDKNGKLLSKLEERKERWKEYVEELYDKAGRPDWRKLIEEESFVEVDNVGPDILQVEVEAAIKTMHKNKAVGIDGIPAEMWKVLGKEAIRYITDMCQEVYLSGEWPKEFTKTVMIPIPKKANATECSDFRTISLIPHISKILLKILQQRLQGRVGDYIGKTQFGFRRGMGTRDAIGVMRMICERSLELDNDSYICFVDFEKAFDRVDWVKMMEVLRKVGADWRDRRLIADLYMKQEIAVRIGSECTEETVIGRGVRQGCLLSPLLFSLYAETMMNEAMESIEEGIKVGGQYLADVRFADDQAMVAESNRGLQRIMDRLNETAKKYEMRINIKKTKVMKVSREGGGVVEVILDGQKIEQVDKYLYLGSWINEDGKCDAEVKSRIAQAKEAFGKRKELLCRNVSKKIKKQIVNAMVWSVILYGSETWSLKTEERRRINAFEMWVWRRIEKISWMDHVKNEEVLKRVGQKQELVDMIIKRKKNWIGHVLRGEGLLKEVIEGRMCGKRGRGRPRIGMLDVLLEGNKFHIMKRRAEDRKKWRCWMPRTC